MKKSDSKWATPTALALVIVFLVTGTGQVAQAQTLNVLYNFSGAQDGSNPDAGLTMDQAGNFYGTASSGGLGFGTVFKLSLKNSQWVLSPLYSFAGGNDGNSPQSRVVFGPDGSLYGVTSAGGGAPDAGTVFNLKPPLTSCKSAICPWTETVLYRFAGQADGSFPGWGDLAFDQAGNIYGTTVAGGAGYGVVYKLTRSGNSWTQSVLYTFNGNPDGANPYGGLIFDAAGNLYGTTIQGGGKAGCGTFGCGTVFQLTPSSSGWTETILHYFKIDQSEGNAPYGGLLMDASGNLYGTTCYGGTTFGGTVYQLTPSNGGWTFTLLDDGLPRIGLVNAGPYASLIMDPAGNLYGSTYGGGALYDAGTVFKLTNSGGVWTYSSLHDFTKGSDGYYVPGSVVLDAKGNVYGTTKYAGGFGDGIAFEITP